MIDYKHENFWVLLNYKILFILLNIINFKHFMIYLLKILKIKCFILQKFIYISYYKNSLILI